MYSNLLFPPFRCRPPAQNKNDLGRVSTKTNENSNSNDNSLKSFRH